MSVLGRTALLDAIRCRPLDERLIVMPLIRAEQIGDASIDVRLGTQFFVLRRTEGSGLDPCTITQSQVERIYERVITPFGQPLWLHPGQFVLGATLEYLRFPYDLAADVVGRSSWGRIGLLVATAVMVQPGYCGALTLELVNHGDEPIALYPGSRIAQLAIRNVDGEADGYTGKYRGSTGPQVSHVAREREEINALQRTAELLALPAVPNLGSSRETQKD